MQRECYRPELMASNVKRGNAGSGGVSILTMTRWRLGLISDSGLHQQQGRDLSLRQGFVCRGTGESALRHYHVLVGRIVGRFPLNDCECLSSVHRVEVPRGEAVVGDHLHHNIVGRWPLVGRHHTDLQGMRQRLILCLHPSVSKPQPAVQVGVGMERKPTRNRYCSSRCTITVTLWEVVVVL